MKIEEEIKQYKFKGEYQKLMINLLFTGKWTSNIATYYVKDHKLTSQQYNVLRILRGQKNNCITVNAISERMIDKMSNVSRLIDKLKDKGLVERTINSDDRRQVDIQITQKGIDTIASIEAKENEMFERFKTLNEQEATALNNLLDKLRG